MSQIISIFDRMKSQNGTLISYYARPSSFTTGGVSASSADWMKSFSDYGVKNLVCAYMKNGLPPLGETAKKIPIKHVLNHRVFSVPTDFSFLRNDISLVYLHEGWTFSNIWVAAFCFVHKIPYAVMPHGVYEPEIVKTLKWLKIRRILEKLVLRQANFVHLYFEGEKENVFKISKSARVAVAPTALNQIENYDKSWVGTGDYFLYAGRIDPSAKGLDLLIECWKDSGRSEKLLLAGPDYNDGVDFVQNLIAKLNLQDKIILLGNLNSVDLQRLMRNARGFLHISRWESYGRSAIDAIRMGIPTLLSTQMHISHVKPISNLAYITSLEYQDIIAGINLIGNLRPEEHKKSLELNFEEFANFLKWERVMNSLVSQI